SLIFMYAPVMVPIAVIWKDCYMAGGLLLGLGGLLSARRTGNRRHALVALIPLWWATAVRYNAFAATLPIVLFLFEWRPGMAWLKRYAVALGAWLAITLAAFAFNAVLVVRQVHFWQSSLAPFDIAGTLAYVDDDLPDAELAKTLDGTGLVPTSNIHAIAR